MKYTTILAALSLGLPILLATGCVQDQPYVRQEVQDDHDSDFRGKVHRLREHYNRVLDEAERSGAGTHVREQLAEIDSGIHRVASFVFSGDFVPERAQENISRLHQELHEVSDELHR